MIQIAQTYKLCRLFMYVYMRGVMYISTRRMDEKLPVEYTYVYVYNIVLLQIYYIEFHVRYYIIIRRRYNVIIIFDVVVVVGVCAAASSGKKKKAFQKTPIPIEGEPGDAAYKIIYSIYKRDMTIHSVCVRVYARCQRNMYIDRVRRWAHTVVSCIMALANRIHYIIII